MNLHNEIMNIQIDKDLLTVYDRFTLAAYKVGHRDARHDAAELSLKAEAYIASLEYYIRKMAGDGILQEIKEEVGV